MAQKVILSNLPVERELYEDVGDALYTVDAGYVLALDYDGSNRLIYKGWAKPSTAKAAAGWAIQKFTYDGSGNLTDVQWADGNVLLDNVWNNRASLSYS